MRNLLTRVPKSAQVMMVATLVRAVFAQSDTDQVPVEHWKQIWSNNGQERLNKEFRRHTDMVGVLPQPTGFHSALRRRFGRATRRVDDRPALHEHGIPRQGSAPGSWPASRSERR